MPVGDAGEPSEMLIPYLRCDAAAPSSRAPRAGPRLIHLGDFRGDARNVGVRLIQCTASRTLRDLIGPTGIQGLSCVVAAALTILAGCGGDPADDAEDVVVQAGPRTVFRADSTPLVRIGAVDDGPDAYLFSDISGAKRLSDGRIVATVRGMQEVRMFAAEGMHLWSSGREGDGPGEYRRPVLQGSCSDVESGVVVYDSGNEQVTILSVDGEVLASRRVLLHPFDYEVACAPGGRLALSSYESLLHPRDGVYRWRQSMAYADPPYSDVEVFRKDLPGAERFQLSKSGTSPISGPRTWGRKLHFAAREEGIWIGTGDDYLVDFLDWTGVARRRIRWQGPDQEVKQTHLDAYRAFIRDMYKLMGVEDWRSRSESYWNEDRPFLPDEFPSTSRILNSQDGGIWVEQFPRSRESRAWLHFDESGEWTGTLNIPGWWTLMDAASDWILVRRKTRDLDVEYLELYRLLPTG